MKKVKALALLIAILLSVESAHSAPEWCEVLVAPEQVNSDGTDGFIGYLGRLLEHQLIGDFELRKLAGGLERGMLSNPISGENAQLDSRLMVHHEGLQERLDHSLIDPARLLDWVKHELLQRERVRIRRVETKETTRDMYRRTEFRRIEPGTFQMGEDNQFVTVTLTEPFEFGATLVTQRQWVMIMGENPSQFKQGDLMDSMQPDHPVEQVSWFMAQNFIDRLNTLSMNDDPLLHQVIIGHRKGDRYRLPTEAEWEFVAKNRGTNSGKYFFGDDEKELKKYAWYRESSGYRTHAVGELKPLMTDDGPIYDLHGNVAEWMQDWHGPLPYGESVTNPTGPLTGEYVDGGNRMLRGGSWEYSAQHCRLAQRAWDLPDTRSSWVGVRLVRSRGGGK